MKYPELLSPNAAQARDAVLDRMRREDPLYWCDHEAIRAWFVTRYDDVFELFKDERFEFGSTKAELLKQSKREQEEFQPLVVAMDNLMSAMPRERHKQVQKVLLEFLSMKFLKSFKDDIVAIVDKAIESISDEDEVNMVERFSYPIPAHVVASLLGIPREDWQQFIEWTSALQALFWPYDYERYSNANRCIAGMMDYFRDLMPRMADSGKECLLARLGEAVKGGVITEDEALVNSAIIMFAGHETTATVINEGIQLLFSQPGLLETLKEDPSLISKATTEILRYRPAVGWMRRTAMEDVEYQGIQIKKDSVLYLGTYAANRDPEYFPDPHRFDIHREFKNPSLTFGMGRHYCLGAALAQMEIELALSTLIERFPDMHLDLDRVKRSPTMMLMDAIVDLPLELRAS